MRSDSERLAKNNFDLLRLMFALIVCLVHIAELSGMAALAWIQSSLSSLLAIKAFFVVSGFLIFRSFEQSGSLRQYASKRARRILPGYVAIILICAFGLAALTTFPLDAYFSATWWKYIGANLVFLNFLQPTLPGVFEANRYDAVNGALWTLKIEVAFYLLVPVFVRAFRRFGHLTVIGVVYLLSLVYAGVCAEAAARTGHGLYLELGRQIPGQLAYFMAGALLFYCLPAFVARAGLWVAIAGGVLLLNQWWPLGALEPLALAVAVVYLAVMIRPFDVGRRADISYGVYIIHFPLIQTLIDARWFVDRPFLLLVTTLSLTLVAAVVMWHLVERRFLIRYRKSATEPVLAPSDPRVESARLTGPGTH